MSVSISADGTLEVVSSGFGTGGRGWARSRANGNLYASPWQAGIHVVDGVNEVAFVITDQNIGGFISWNAAPDPYRLLVIIHGGGSGLDYPYVGAGGRDPGTSPFWQDLQDDHDARVVGIKWFDVMDDGGPPNQPGGTKGAGRTQRTIVNHAATMGEMQDRCVEVLEWIDANLNPLERSIAIIGSSGGAEVVISPFSRESPLTSRIVFAGLCSVPGIFLDLRDTCNATNDPDKYVDEFTGEYTSDPGDFGATQNGVAWADDVLYNDLCSTGAMTEVASEDSNTVEMLDAQTPWWTGRLFCSLGRSGGSDEQEVWGNGRIFNDPFFSLASRRWFRSAVDFHGYALTQPTSEGFAEIYAELSALADFGEGEVSKGNTFENDLQKLTFQATAIANIADNAASAPLTNLQVSLHTADPGEAGDQTTNEIAYTSYARVAVARTSGGWAVSTNTVTPVANIDFPAGTGGSGTATHFAVGTASSGAGKILYSGTVTPNIVCGSGVTPRLTTASTITED